MKALAFALLAAAATLGAAGRCGASAGLRLEPQSALWIEGDSTLHRWSSTSTALGFTADVPPGKSAEEILRGGLVKGVKVTVPIASLKSGETGLDKNMQKALKAGDEPDIVFQLDGYRIAKEGDAARIDATGTLSIAGKDRTIQLEAVWKTRDGRAVIDGRYPLEMTDYGVKPPTLMLGAIKVDKHVAVQFHLELAADESQTGAKQR